MKTHKIFFLVSLFTITTTAVAMDDTDDTEMVVAAPGSPENQFQFNEDWVRGKFTAVAEQQTQDLLKKIDEERTIRTEKITTLLEEQGQLRQQLITVDLSLHQLTMETEKLRRVEDIVKAKSGVIQANIDGYYEVTAADCTRPPQNSGLEISYYFREFRRMILEKIGELELPESLKNLDIFRNGGGD